jgi:hypothetical protein
MDATRTYTKLNSAPILSGTFYPTGALVPFRRCAVATANCDRALCPAFSLYAKRMWIEDARTLRNRCQMQHFRIFKTAFSLAAIASTIFVVSWVGLALLGY